MMMSWCGSEMVCGYGAFGLVFVVGEILFHLVFYLVVKLFSLTARPSLSGLEVFKGILERLFVSVGVAHGVTTTVVAFAALKVATRLSVSVPNLDSKSKITDPQIKEVFKQNNYFLVGNLLSLSFALAYALIARVMGFVEVLMVG